MYSQRRKVEKNTQSKPTLTCQKFARNFVQTRLGGESRAGDVIMHKAYLESMRVETVIYGTFPSYLGRVMQFIVFSTK